MIKYPYDIVSLVRNKTFAVSAKFGTNEEAEPNTEEEAGSPLSIFASFSRYNFCIIENGAATDANLKLDAIAGLKEWAQNGVLLDLTESLNEDEDWKNTFLEGALDTYDLSAYGADGIYALPNELNVDAIFYNKALFEKAGIEKVTALIEVRVTPQRGMGFDKVAERIYNYPEVNSVYLISGGFDFMVTIEGKTLREVSQFVSDKLSPLDSVLSTKTNFILKKYKDHGTVMAEQAKDERIEM